MRGVCGVAAVLLAACSFDGVPPGPGAADAMRSSDAGEFDAPPSDASVTGTLVDRGLLVRYFLDEAAIGQVPTQALDATSVSLDLDIFYETSLTYETVGANRGLRFGAVGTDDRVLANIDGTKLLQLSGGTSGTIEVVADVRGASASNSRLLHIGVDDESHFSLEVDDRNPSPVEYVVNTQGFGVAARFAVDPTTLGRVVVHMVFDSTEESQADRTKLFIDGVQQADPYVDNVQQNETITIGDVGAYLALGNRDQFRSFEGDLFYAAVYHQVLTAAEIATNAAVLVVSDDSR